MLLSQEVRMVKGSVESYDTKLIDLEDRLDELDRAIEKLEDKLE